MDEKDAREIFMDTEQGIQIVIRNMDDPKKRRREVKNLNEQFAW